MMQWPGGRILQRHELDAFLAQAVSSQLYEPDQLQELKVRPHSLIVRLSLIRVFSTVVSAHNAQFISSSLFFFFLFSCVLVE